MNRYKLTPLEELQLEKKRLNEQRMISSQRLSYQLQYLSDNWGTMLTKGVSSSIKTKFSETLDNLTADGPHIPPYMTRRSRSWLNNAAVNLIVSNLPLIGSIAWKITKPALFAYVTRQATARIFGKRGRK
ncbi:MAG TPA: hypothetical protein GXZ56_09080 [Bacteroidales bacterium]|jgi:hypothetical protein|nr:hypothetical protein [Bacteroidales bacterium]